MNARLIGGVLAVILGVALLVSSSGAVNIEIPDITHPFEKDGRVKTCQVAFDKDSINAFSCTSGDLCIVPKKGILGLFDVDRELQLNALGKTYDSEKVDANFVGIDSKTVLEGCIPLEASSASIDLYNTDGAKLDSDQVSLS